MKRWMALAALAALTVGAHAADPYPSKPITIVVPFAAGGPTDRVARDLAEALRKPLGGATVIIDNSAGACSSIGSNKVAKAEIAMIKIVAPNMACQIIDWAIQAHGGGGVSQDFPLAYAYAHQRTLRLADGPDEVHRNSLAKLEYARHMTLPGEVDMPITRGS